jgi:hypothetical protein
LYKAHPKTVKMSTPSTLFPPRSAEDEARLDAFIHPKVAGGTDGNCMVSAKKMQAIYDELSVVLEEAHEILRISRRAAHASLLSEPLAIHFTGITQKTPILYKKLSKLTTDLHLSLPMAGMEFDHLKEYPPVKIAFVEAEDAPELPPLKPCYPLPVDDGKSAQLVQLMPAYRMGSLTCGALDPPSAPPTSDPLIFAVYVDKLPPPPPPSTDDEEDLYA